MYRFGPLTTSLRLSLVRRAGVSAVPQFVPSDGNALTFPIQRFNIYQPKRFDVIKERKQFQSRRIRIRRPEETEVEAIQRLCDQIINDMNEDKFLFNLTDQQVSNRMCTISPKVAVDLAINMFEKEGLEKTIEFLNGCKKRFTIRSKAKPSIEVIQKVRELYRRLFETVELSDPMTLQLSDALIRAEIVQTPDIFLEECVKRNLEKHNFGVAFGSFASKSAAERSVSGCSHLFDFILADEQDFQCVREQRIKMVVNHVQSLKTPAYALAELVTASLKMNKMQDAEILVKYFVVKPRNFVECVKRLREECDLVTLERFGTLFAKCYYEQLRSKPKKAKKSTKIGENLEKSDVEVEEEVTPEVLGQFEFLVKEAQAKKRRRKFTLAKKTVKKHEIDPKQLDLLTRVFVNVWINSAVEKADTNSLATLFEWVSYHNVELREFQFDRLRECHIKAGIPNPFSKLQKNSNQISERAQLQGLF